ncbi:1,4-alpha-glucan branching enzyme [Natranaerovirga pectinivora]|uniref:1,4-alpha-glucan branching enzyme GlgB n=1 Tax=Natranaerovirga pectinivora TaxID=682400 RepID=A0A4R3MKX8_9FIRM|nr:1,4-alpha-glucan branching protein GlgB [Natranaerovirga pectinivora]TCT15366.1 1,4-alpha-glucan branching enzyme [Natranaerovirga pectinivora]
MKSFSDYDLHLFHEGSHYKAYEFLGSRPFEVNKKKGILFSLWAPNAKEVSVIGDFNNWDGNSHKMKKEMNQEVWTLFIPGMLVGDLYKYEVVTEDNQIRVKADPYAFYSELRPKTASIVYDLSGYKWEDENWIKAKSIKNVYEEPTNIYEVHLGSWKKDGEEFLNYGQLAEELIPYVKEMGYTHIELLPITEHPFDGSWGYQSTGYYSVTSRYGTPHDFMSFIDQCHQRNIGVILDWVPGHFCKDDFGLANFDGTKLYEYKDVNRSENYGWGTLNFDLGRPEVLSFLISNALFWLDKYHIDGIRVDAVAAMLYLDYCKEPNQWVPNKFGGRENLEAIQFMKKLNEAIFKYHSNCLVIAEESTAWPLVTMPTYLGGLGYNYKWNMGWMNDILSYMKKDPIHKKYNHNMLTFSLTYAFSENFVLPLSHDEVVHGKCSLINKMPGDYWQKFANLRLMYMYMTGHPGKKLLFMGSEFGQFIEWDYKKELDWFLLEYDMHKNTQSFVKDLNHFYLEDSSLWEQDQGWDGFEWIDPNDYSQSVISFIRKGREKSNFTIAIYNFTPVVRENYRIGVPYIGEYIEVLNSDNSQYGGSNQTNNLIISSEAIPWHGKENSIEIKLPPLGSVFIKMVNQTRKLKGAL